MDVPQPLVIAVTPYHLATREPPALCALLLADRVVTLMPTPESGGDRSSFDTAVRRSPRFIRFMDRIRWSVPLWNAGVISGEWQSESLSAGLRDVCVRAADDDSMLAMKRMFEAVSREQEFEFLDHVCADLLKGGPDPSVSIPIAACIDEFAARHGVHVARAAASSVAQRAESMLHRRRRSFVAPILTQASGKRVLELRDRLRDELGAVRRAIVRESAAMSDGAGGGYEAGAEEGELSDAARLLSAGFERARRDLVRGDDDSDHRVMDGYVSVSIVDAPADAVFRSSMHALRSGSISSRGGAMPSAGVRAPASRAANGLRALVIKSLNMRPSM